MGIPLLEGRYLSDTDRREAPSVVVVTETLARRLWPTESALGKRLKQGWPESEGTASPGVRSLASSGISARMASMRSPDPKHSSPSGKRPRLYGVGDTNHG